MTMPILQDAGMNPAGGGGGGADVVPDWVDVSAFATSGSGTQGDPWVGWDTFITWSGDHPYYFRSGYFAAGANPAWSDVTGLSLIGDSSVKTVLVFTGGAGKAWQFTNSVYLTRRNLRIENLQFQGNAAGTTTDVLYFLDCHNGKISNVKTMNGTDNGLHFEGGVTNHIENFSHSVLEIGVVTYAQHGISIDSGSSNFPMTDSVFVNTNIDGTLDTGLQLNAATYCTFLGGVVENCIKGIYFGGSQTSFANQFIGMDVEGITGGDAFNFGGDCFSNTIFGGLVVETIRFPAASVSNGIVGGTHASIIIEGAALSTFVIAVGSTVVTDAGTGTRLYAVRDLTNGVDRSDTLVKGHAVGLTSYLNNAAAVIGGLGAGDLYTITGSDPLQVAVVF